MKLIGAAGYKFCNNHFFLLLSQYCTDSALQSTCGLMTQNVCICTIVLAAQRGIAWHAVDVQQPCIILRPLTYFACKW